MRSIRELYSGISKSLSLHGWCLIWHRLGLVLQVSLNMLIYSCNYMHIMWTCIPAGKIQAHALLWYHVTSWYKCLSIGSMVCIPCYFCVTFFWYLPVLNFKTWINTKCQNLRNNIYGFTCFSRIAADIERLQRMKVTHVVNCAQGKKFCQINTSEEYFADTGIHFFGIQNAMDMPKFKLFTYFFTAANFIEEALSSNGKDTWI